jgi:acyl carrier protein
MSRELKEQLIRFVSDELLSGTAEVRGDEDLLADGLVDSLGMVRLVGYLEAQLGMTVPPVDFTIENFRSIDTVVAYARRRVPEVAGGE